MPRVRAPPAASAAQPSPFKSPVKIPLNDDKQEKAKRLQSRQLFHEAQMNSLKAAATPTRKRRSLAPDGPNTPQDGEDGVYVGGAAVTPMKRVPILANFEEWMKMATDNKINATNSWNFALIDYFHDMSLLKEGDGVNFQKASCTLDGCVKIYTSRVDSVATETGKLLSGLADSGNKKSRGDEESGEGDEEDEEGEDGVKKRAKKKTTRSAEATLATSFAQLQLKKMELEFAVDPLFKKASADFDEGGAKGLLLNHLCIDNTGRIVFDSSDDAQQELLEDSRRDSMDPDEKDEEPAEATSHERSDTQIESTPVDIAGLGARFFPNLALLDSQSICPSMETFELGSGTGTLDLPFLKAAEDWKKEQESKAASANDLDDARSGIVLDDDNAMGFDDDLGGFDLPPDTGFGEGGEAWAREANIASQPRPHVIGPEGDGEAGSDGEVVGNFDGASAFYGVTLVHRAADEQANILSYFDSALAKNWAGPEHWKIKRVKDATKASSAPATSRRKEKEPFEIDFHSPMTQSLADLLYTSATSNATISLPKTQRRSKTRNLLPDDKHFNSRSLLTLFLKPKARLGARRSAHTSSSSSSTQPPAVGDVDEAYWAQHANTPEPLPEDVLPGAYDADFFQDDGLPAGAGADDDNDDFADAHETLAPALTDAATPSDGAAFGAQLVAQSRRARPEYVQYARVAKKVDVRRLKEEMWRGLGMGEDAEKVRFHSRHSDGGQELTRVPQTNSDISKLPAPTQTDGSLRFTDVVNNLQHVYPKQQMADISTSFCFIALLHLANEKGLVITNGEDFQELSIRRDHTAEIVAGSD
ncbi:barren [Myriangium duriaei CBS 260.36]|uniref:Condensin complex subunit 2 n=1 Tax=Myriangium duriaei CBS 260.36 TaxID=1168546 RepID=A0A9P4MDF5_9PEZI|nr:barren [Myriangium duriaei CBS 260.36]